MKGSGAVSVERNTIKSEGSKQLLEACLFGMHDKVQLLLATKLVRVNVHSDSTGTPLSLAAAVGSTRCKRIPNSPRWRAWPACG